MNDNSESQQDLGFRRILCCCLHWCVHADEKRPYKKTEGERGWERPRRYQHGNTTATPADNDRWSRGLRVPETAAATAGTGAGNKAGDAQADTAQA